MGPLMPRQATEERILPDVSNAPNGDIGRLFQAYSITSSASATKFGGSSMPVAFAVFRLITNG